MLLITYHGQGAEGASTRSIEPVSLCFYSLHWHLIAWCRLRKDYRDSRLDRLQDLDRLPERFKKRDRRTLQEYLATRDNGKDLHEVVLNFSPEAAHFMGEQLFHFDHVGRCETESGIEMTFLTSHMDYLGRWLLACTDGVTLVRGAALSDVMKRLVSDLEKRWRCG